MQGARSGQGRLGRFAGDGANELVFRERDSARAGERPFGVRALEFAGQALLPLKGQGRQAGGQAVHGFNEPSEPGAAPEFPVGNGAQPHLFLHLHGLPDALVLDGGEGVARDLPGLEFPRGPLEFGRAEQTSDVLGAERGRGQAHGESLLG